MSPQPQANTPPSELEAALEYARLGTPVFPCKRAALDFFLG
jgi:hypothetical protein